MQTQQMEMARDGIVESFVSEFRRRWHEVPNKALFFGVLILWMALFQWFGISTFGYISTASLPRWMLNAYVNPDLQDDIHGVLVPFLVLGLFWWKRRELLSTPVRIWWPALVGLLLALVLHLAGYMVQQARVSIVAMFFGIYCLIGLAWGPGWMVRSFFPFVLLVFCIPLSTLPFFNDRITFPLRMLSAWIVDSIAHLGLAPDLKREGTQLYYQSATHRWNVDIAPACSGIRGLTALALMTITYGMIVFREPWKRLVMICSAVPLAVLNNVLRISFAVLVGRIWGEEQLKSVEQKAGFYTFLFIAIPLVLGTGWLLGDRWWGAPAAERKPDATPPDGMAGGDGSMKVDPPEPGSSVGATRRVIPLFVVCAAMILGGAFLLGWLQNHQKLGNPGVRTSRLEGQPADSLKVRIELPEWVSVYQAEPFEMDERLERGLPADTSFGQKLYTAPDKFQVLVTGVLMGMDRTSIHKPQFCLQGGGWTIEKQTSAAVPVPEPEPYDLPVTVMHVSRMIEHEGQQYRQAGLYVYWFVEENKITARHEERMMSMARSMLTKGVLERWAYISCFVICPPNGGEDWAFERLKRFLASGVPKFQIPGGAPKVAATDAGQVSN